MHEKVQQKVDNSMSQSELARTKAKLGPLQKCEFFGYKKRGGYILIRATRSFSRFSRSSGLSRSESVLLAAAITLLPWRICSCATASWYVVQSTDGTESVYRQPAHDSRRSRFLCRQQLIIVHCQCFNFASMFWFWNPAAPRKFHRCSQADLRWSLFPILVSVDRTIRPRAFRSFCVAFGSQLESTKKLSIFATRMPEGTGALETDAPADPTWQVFDVVSWVRVCPVKPEAWPGRRERRESRAPRGGPLGEEGGATPGSGFVWPPRSGGACRLRRNNHNAARFKTPETGHGGLIAATRSYRRLRKPRTIQRTSLHHGRATVAEPRLRQHGSHLRGRGESQQQVRNSGSAPAERPSAYPRMHHLKPFKTLDPFSGQLFVLFECQSAVLAKQEATVSSWFCKKKKKVSIAKKGRNWNELQLQTYF